MDRVKLTILLEHKIFPKGNLFMKIDIKNNIGFIYLTTNKIDSRKYIGQKTFNRGWKTYLGSGTILREAIKKYGAKNFNREILYVCKDMQELNEKEIYYIKLYDAVKSKMFYNLASGGNNSEKNDIWEKFSSEKKEKIRENLRIKNSGEGNPFYGKHHSEKAKKILRIKSYRRNLGINNPFYGKHHSERTKKIIAEKAKIRYCGENNPFYGKHHTKESKRKISLKSKPVGQYDLNFNLINKFISTKEASIITGVSLTGMRQCVIGKSNKSGGYIWKYI
jgi:group I intron endonuclease